MTFEVAEVDVSAKGKWLVGQESLGGISKNDRQLGAFLPSRNMANYFHFCPHSFSLTRN